MIAPKDKIDGATIDFYGHDDRYHVQSKEDLSISCTIHVMLATVQECQMAGYTCCNQETVSEDDSHDQ